MWQYFSDGRQMMYCVVSIVADEIGKGINLFIPIQCLEFRYGRRSIADVLINMYNHG